LPRVTSSVFDTGRGSIPCESISVREDNPQKAHLPVYDLGLTGSVSEDLLIADMVSVRFIHTNQLTLCVLTSRSGFEVCGEAGTIDPQNYFYDLGRFYSFSDAKAKLWKLLAFAKQRNGAMAGEQGSPFPPPVHVTHSPDNNG
jgi:hypothetical protein